MKNKIWSGEKTKAIIIQQSCEDLFVIAAMPCFSKVEFFFFELFWYADIKNKF
jgi:hypothetical protein